MFNDVRLNAFGTETKTAYLYEAALVSTTWWPEKSTLETTTPQTLTDCNICKRGLYDRLTRASRVELVYVKKLLLHTRAQYLELADRLVDAEEPERSIDPEAKALFGDRYRRFLELIHNRAVFFAEHVMEEASSLGYKEYEEMRRLAADQMKAHRNDMNKVRIQDARSELPPPPSPSS